MTHTENYQPGIDTLAARVAAFLHSLPAGIECGTRHIVEGTGLADNEVTPATTTTIKHGLVIREHVGTRWLYRRGLRDLAPEIVERYAGTFKPVQIEPGLREHHTMSRPNLAPRVIPASAPADAPVLVMREAIAAARQAEPQPLVAGLYSDGRMSVERPGHEPVIFNPRETFHLVKFLATCGRIGDMLQEGQ